MPLIHQLPPYPWESLSSFVERLRQRNYYEDRGAIRDLLAPDYLNLDLLRQAADYNRLAELTGLSSDALYELTLHRFVAVYDPPAAQTPQPEWPGDVARPLWKYRGVPRYLQGRQRDPVCPLCWQERPAYLLPWKLRQVTTCPQHEVLLVDQCSRCRQPLRRAGVTGACIQCGQPLVDLPVVSVGEPRGSCTLTAVVWRALGGAATPFPPAGLGLAAEHPLGQMLPATLLRFLWLMGQLLPAYDPANPAGAGQTATPPDGERPGVLNRRRWALPGVQFHQVLDAAWQILLDWPQGWYGVLERIAATEHAAAPRRYRHCFPQVLRRQFRGPEWVWLHGGWVAFMQREMLSNPRLGGWVPYYRALEQQGAVERLFLSPLEAGEALGVTPRSISRYLAAGVLTATANGAPGDRRRRALVAAARVEELAAARSAYLGTEAAARYCGLRVKQLRALEQTGQVRPVTGVVAGPARVGRLYAVAELDGFLAGVVGECPLGAEESGARALDWRGLVRRLARTGLGLGAVLEDIRQGRLGAWRVAGGRNLADLRFPLGRVRSYLEEQQLADGRVLYAVAKVCMVLGCDRVTLARWERAGLLHPATGERRVLPGQRWYEAEEVAAFAASYIRTQAAAALLECRATTIRAWARAGRLAVLAGHTAHGRYRFDQQQLVAWRQARA